MKPSELHKLENTIGYTFRDHKLLTMALTHKSYCYPNRIESNERLEFLGDSVLQLCVGDYLYTHYPNEDEGKLTRIRSRAVRRETLANCSRRYGLGGLLRMGVGERHTGGQDKDSILEDAFEALVGAIYLDGGFACARKFILASIEDVLLDKNSLLSDSKTRLQEIFQAHGETVEYEWLSQEGPAHDRRFTFSVKNKGVVLGVGTGKTKKEAEARAAKAALQLIDERGYECVSEKD